MLCAGRAVGRLQHCRTPSHPSCSHVSEDISLCSSSLLGCALQVFGGDPHPELHNCLNVSTFPTGKFASSTAATAEHHTVPGEASALWFEIIINH